ncbi:MAG: putative DNA binding domain-containing protein [Prevotellaceae bacterium]|jgi:predicted HTH transcriptional regulator|nr:putative DNA binding domain-containing protein [Prevotellaceae bacterium]
MTEQNLIELIDELVKSPKENEYLEFKLNFHSVEEIGEQISALSNTACLQNQANGYLVFGVENETKKIIGTTFNAKTHKKGNEDLEHWLATRLNPRIDFTIYQFDYEWDKHISLFVIPAIQSRPVTFLNKAYIRVGSITRQLSDFAEKERKIWNTGDYLLENDIAKSGLSTSDIVRLLSTETYFELLEIPYPSNQEGVINKFLSEQLIVKQTKNYAITKLGAILFAKNLNDFDSLSRKSVRVIVYKGKGKNETVREQIFTKGYCVGFDSMLEWINGQLPASEVIGQAKRIDQRAYPKVSVRELVANAIIHQDFEKKGFPMVEIFSDRVAISNPGQPLIVPERFIDEYVSRDEKTADLMRRSHFCEEKGSGVDKVIANNEAYHLPPINILVDDLRTTVTIYSYQKLSEMSRKDKISACYQHCCLQYMLNQKMTNQTLRERFEVEEKNYSTISRIIKETIRVGAIKEEDPENKAKRYTKYLPFWG